jgi:hypothetical protein
MRAALPLLAAVLACSAPVRPLPPAPPPLRPAPIEDPLPVVGELGEIPGGRLSHVFEPTRYAASLNMDPTWGDFTGTIEITGELAEPRDVLWLHAEGLTIGRVTAIRDGVVQRLVPRMPTNQLLALQSPSPLATGTWTLSIAYSGRWNDAEPEGGFRQQLSDGTTTDLGLHYVFTLFEPDYARRVFPSIDEPDRKVPWQLTITAPAGLEVVGNAPVEKIESAGGKQTVRFAQTPPIPTYLVAFAVGPFEVIDGGRAKSGVPVRILTQRGYRALTTYAASATAGLIDNVEAWIGVPFPYAKLDVVTVPRTPHWWYAMENPGLITTSLGSLEDAAMWNHTMAHEIAHHWFGDLVTLAWWDDLWLNESLTEWVAQQAAGAPRSRLAYSPSVVRSSIFNTRRDWNVDGIRQKGEALIARLAVYLGNDKLRTALAQYLQAHAHGSVTTQDLVAALDAASGEKLGPLVDDFWSGRHITTGTVECKRRKRPRYVVRVPTGLVDANPVACVTYDSDGKRVETCKRVSGKPLGFDLDAQRCPRWMIGEQLERRELGALRDQAWDELTSHEQGLLVTSLELRNGMLPWDIVAKMIRSRWPAVRHYVVDTLWYARWNLEASLRTRLDAWIVDQLGAEARSDGFERAPHVAALVAAAGDTTLLAQAHKHVDERSISRSMYARRALVNADANYAAKRFESLLDNRYESEWTYSDLLQSPFIFELVRNNVDRVKAKLGAAYLRSIQCSAPADDFIALAKTLAPDAWDQYTDRKVLDDCIVSRRNLTDDVRKFLDAAAKKPPR